MIYLDHAATTPVDPEVLEAMLPFFADRYGNPSSIHRPGREASEAVDIARRAIAGLIGAGAGEIVFTSGGTESNNQALAGAAGSSRGGHIVTSGIEHPSVLNTCRFLQRRGLRVTYVPADRHGLVDPGDVLKALTGRTAVISIMHANNEVGTIQPLEEIGKIARDRGICFHTDAVQTFGHVPVDVDALGAHLLSASSHKLYGPKGVGLLYVRADTVIAPLLHGGGQEAGRRASTLNVPGIVGFGKAAALARESMEAEANRLAGLRDRLVRGVLGEIEGAGLTGHPRHRLPNNASFIFERVDGVSLLLRLDLEGIACSVGSACSFGDREPPHTLRAMGFSDEEARGAVRFSLGRRTSKEDVDRVIDSLRNIVLDLRGGLPSSDRTPRGRNSASSCTSDSASPGPATQSRSAGHVDAGPPTRPEPGTPETGPGRSGACRVTRIQGGSRELVEDRVVTEVPLTILLDGRELATIVCTPEDLPELAAGYLFSEGIVSSREDIRSMTLRRDLGAVQVETAPCAATREGRPAPGVRLSRFITPGCFSHTVSGAGAEQVDSRVTVPASRLLDLVKQMGKLSRLYASTGGVHSAALCDQHGILFFNEDVGRHNAVDKLLGKCLLRGVSTRDKILAMSGRVSSAMMVKVINARIPVAVSRSAPTTESVKVSDRFGVTLVGFARGNRMNVYSNEWRVVP